MTLTSTFLIYPPIVFLSNSIRVLVTSSARSTRETGTYLLIIALIASLPGLALALFPVKSTYWAMLIPIFEQQLLINQFMRYVPGSLSTVTTIPLSIAITFLGLKTF